MNKVLEYIKLARPINIFIVFVTQLIIYHFVINNNIHNVALTQLDQILLAIATAIVAASGYVINDLFDVDIDNINKPQTTIVDKTISIKAAKSFYFLLNSIGFLISLYLALKTDNIKLLIIYPIGCLMLFLYAKYLKRSGLLGNIVVSLMIFFVCALVIIAERKVLFTIENFKYLLLITSFGVFALFINLVREIVKDMEDIEGDRLINSKSLPIVLGIERSKVLCYLNLIISISLCLIFIRMYPHDYRTMAFNYLMIIVPSIVSMMRLYKAKEKKDFHQLSSLLKVIMSFGLIYLILLSYVK